MRYLTSNLFFNAFVIVGLGTLIWYIFTERPKVEKQSILSVFTDLIFNFVLTLFGVNALFNLNEIIETPYRILIFSSDVVSLATLITAAYGAYKYGEKLWQNSQKAISVAQLFLFLGLVNHVYFYLLYRNFQTILFIAFFIVVLFFVSFTKIFEKIDSLLFILLSTGVHLLLMRNQPIIYFNFTFYTIPLLIIMLVLVGLLFYQRRKLQLKQN